MTVHQAVLAYKALGWRPIPISPGAKAPSCRDWQTFDADATRLEDDFRSGSNVGLVLGHGGLVDVDLDSTESVTLAPAFLPDTGAVFGRASKPRSHWLYQVEGQVDPREPFADGDMLVEIRASDHQTVVPPSIHPSGEPIEWATADLRPRMIAADALRHAVRLLAVAALLTRHWPERGTRNDTALASAGLLLDCGLEPDDAKQILKAVVMHHGTNEWRERAHSTVDATTRARASGGAYTGGPRLAELLTGDGAESVRRIRKFLGADSEHEELLDRMNACHFIAEAGSDIVIGDERLDGLKLWSPEQFTRLYQRDKVRVPDARRKGQTREESIGRWWLDLNRERGRQRQFAELVFAPPPRVAPRRAYNIWKGFNVEPDASKSWERLGAHLLDVWCGGRQVLYDYVLGWFATMAQKPGVPPEVAIVLRGGRGTGKSMPIREIGDAWFGPRHFAHISEASHLTGHFNAILSGRVLVFADECFWAGDRAGERVMKRLVTEPTLTIERKGIDPTTEDNSVHLIIAGNDDWIAPVGLRERRFFVLDVADTRQRDRTYFSALVQEFRAGGAAGFLASMLARDLSTFEIRDIPETEAAIDQQDRTLDSVDEWLLGKLLDGRWLERHGPWRESVVTENLIRDYEEAADRRAVSVRRFNQRLAKILGPEFRRKRVRLVARGAKGPGACKTSYVYTFPSLKECQTRWDRYTGTRRAWPEPVCMAADHYDEDSTVEAADEGDAAF